VFSGGLDAVGQKVGEGALVAGAGECSVCRDVNA
jgi:hypothetical protein